jgi:small-conductance mechanosensitive channel
VNISFNQLARIEILRLGDSVVTLGGLAASLTVLVVALVASGLATGALRRLRGRLKQGADALYVVEKLLGYGLIVFGVVVGLSSLGLNLSSIAVFAGALGVGVGLGLQGVVKEFVSGLVLIFDRVLNIGDYIELSDGTRGMVEEIGPRATRIRDNDNVDILVPNSHLIDNAVTNWTLKGDTRRIHIPFSVAYGSDKDLVREVVLGAARAVPFTLPDQGARRAQVWLVGFGDSSLNFELLVWPAIDAVKRPRAMNAAYTWAIDDALRGAGIEIPFPQRDVRLRALFGEEGNDALDALKLERTQHAPAAPAPASGANDAADDLMARAKLEAEQADEETSS